MQGRRPADAIEQDFIGVAVFERKLQLPLDGIPQATGGPETGEQLASGSQAQAPQDILSVAEALVNRRRGSSSRLGYGAHGQRPFSAASPQTRCCGQDALFNVGIGMAWQFSSSKTRLNRISSLHSV
jgi:hypothetical protein